MKIHEISILITNMNWSITKTKFSIRVYLMVTFSCMVNMVSGHIAVMSMKHFIIASKVGLVCAVGFALTSLITNKLLQNKFYLAGYVFLATGIIDFFTHASHFGNEYTEAIVTGLVAAIISIIVSFIIEKKFKN